MASIADLVDRHAEPIDAVPDFDTGPLLDRIGDARLVLLGEASHGTSEFYRMRDHVTRALVRDAGFDAVAVEGDWPDCSRVDAYVRQREVRRSEWSAFARFPTWMWRNTDVERFTEFLRGHNLDLGHAERVGFYGLDLYSLSQSLASVVDYLEERDPSLADLARHRYACLGLTGEDGQTYGARHVRGLADCEEDAVRMLQDLLAVRLDGMRGEEEALFDAVQNARVVAGAESYYRTAYRGDRSSWNLRDTHMVDMLDAILRHRGPQSRLVIWAHNSHVGDARETEMGRSRGELNIGQLVRERWPGSSYIVGFGTDTGTVAAASSWDGGMEVKKVRPALADSHERRFHETGIGSFTLPLRDVPQVRRTLSEPLLERAIGVIYRPETERWSHYFSASLGNQFDEYVWFDKTHAVTPLDVTQTEGMPETYPFGV